MNTAAGSGEPHTTIVARHRISVRVLRAAALVLLPLALTSCGAATVGDLALAKASNTDIWDEPPEYVGTPPSALVARGFASKHGESVLKAPASMQDVSAEETPPIAHSVLFELMDGVVLRDDKPGIAQIYALTTSSERGRLSARLGAQGGCRGAQETFRVQGSATMLRPMLMGQDTVYGCSFLGKLPGDDGRRARVVLLTRGTEDGTMMLRVIGLDTTEDAVIAQARASLMSWEVKRFDADPAARPTA